MHLTKTRSIRDLARGELEVKTLFVGCLRRIETPIATEESPHQSPETALKSPAITRLSVGFPRDESDQEL